MNSLKSQMASLKRTVVTLQDTLKWLTLWSGRQAKWLRAIRDKVKILREPIHFSGEYPLLEALVNRNGTSNHGPMVDKLVLGVAFVLHTYSDTADEFLRS
jgi:hypothetical protein